MDFDISTPGTWGESVRRVINTIVLLFFSEFPESTPGYQDIKNTYNAMLQFWEDHPHRSMESAAINLGAITMAVANGKFRDAWPAPEDIVGLLCRKQHDYGQENVSRFGVNGLMVRTHDKIARIENLEARSHAGPLNETILDNYLDLIGYCAIMAMWESGEFLNPLTVVESVAS